MRASKFLSICVAMSRNQAKFFIRKGRLAVNGEVITDPYFELPDDCEVHFDGKPISITNYRYVVLHKPMAFVCATRSAEHASVFELIPDWPDDHYGYFANVLAPEQSGLVLLSDDAPWTNRMKKRLITKPRVYDLTLAEPVSDALLARIQAAQPGDSKDRSAPVVEVTRKSDAVLQVSLRKTDIQSIMQSLLALNLSVSRLHLQQIGRLALGELGEGHCITLTEDAIKV